MVQDETPKQTRTPKYGLPVVLYDGACPFCRKHAKRLYQRAQRKLVLRSFRDDGVLDDFPGLTQEMCLHELKLVEANGSIFGGAEAVTRVLRIGHPFFKNILLSYYVPGIRHTVDAVYRLVARNRYRLSRMDPDDCPDGTCSNHLPS